MGAGLVVGLTSAALVLLGALLAGNTLAPFLVCVAVALPALVIQDCWRQTMFADRDSRGAFFCDLLWLTLEVPLLITAAFVAPHRPIAYVAAWGAAGALTASAYAAHRRMVPSLRGAVRLTRATRSLLPGLFAEFVALTGGQQVLPYGVAAVLGLKAAGVLRAAQLVLGIATVALMGLVPLVLAYAVRAYSAGGISRLHRLQAGFITPGCLWVMAFGAVCYFMPLEAGRAVTGDSWATAHHLIPALTINFTFGWILTVNVIALRAAAMVRRAAITRAVATVAILGLSLGFASVSGIDGAVWGLAAAGGVGAAVSTWSSRRQTYLSPKRAAQPD